MHIYGLSEQIYGTMSIDLGGLFSLPLDFFTRNSTLIHTY